MSKARVHQVLMTVVFDRPCSKKHAVAQAANCIHGTFYPDFQDDKDPGTMKVRSIKAPRKPS